MSSDGSATSRSRGQHQQCHPEESPAATHPTELVLWPAGFPRRYGQQPRSAPRGQAGSGAADSNGTRAEAPEGQVLRVILGPEDSGGGLLRAGV